MVVAAPPLVVVSQYIGYNSVSTPNPLIAGPPGHPPHGSQPFCFLCHTPQGSPTFPEVLKFLSGAPGTGVGPLPAHAKPGTATAHSGTQAGSHPSVWVVPASPLVLFLGLSDSHLSTDLHFLLLPDLCMAQIPGNSGPRAPSSKWDLTSGEVFFPTDSFT